MTAAVNSATYRPAGVLLRTLRLERWLCPSCQRDNLLRRDTSILLRPCRWCGVELLSWAALIKSIPEQIAAAFASLGIAFRRAAETMAGFANLLPPRDGR